MRKLCFGCSLTKFCVMFFPAKTFFFCSRQALKMALSCSRRSLARSLASRCSASAANFLATATGFGADTLALVKFDPSTVEERESWIVFPLVVADESQNAFRSMHGGAVATLADVFTTVHLWGLDPESKHVSAVFDVSYLRPLTAGSTVSCMTRVVKKGKRLAFTEFQFVDSKNTVLARGTHIKAFI
jgi:uncharacterized protein (TIGR00369 family)